MLELGDLVVLTPNLLLQRVDLLAIARDHSTQRELILIELLQIAALRTASSERKCKGERGGADCQVHDLQSRHLYLPTVLTC